MNCTDIGPKVQVIDQRPTQGPSAGARMKGVEFPDIWVIFKYNMLKTFCPWIGWRKHTRLHGYYRGSRMSPLWTESEETEGFKRTGRIARNGRIWLERFKCEACGVDVGRMMDLRRLWRPRSCQVQHWPSTLPSPRPWWARQTLPRAGLWRAIFYQAQSCSSTLPNSCPGGPRQTLPRHRDFFTKEKSVLDTNMEQLHTHIL